MLAFVKASSLHESLVKNPCGKIICFLFFERFNTSSSSYGVLAVLQVHCPCKLYRIFKINSWFTKTIPSSWMFFKAKWAQILVIFPPLNLLSFILPVNSHAQTESLIWINFILFISYIVFQKTSDCLMLNHLFFAAVLSMDWSLGVLYL